MLMGLQALRFFAAAAIWVLTRALMLYQLGYLQAGNIDYQDVNTYHDWGDRIAATHSLPEEPAWQYPPGAALVFLLPRIVPGHYEVAFVGLVLISDLIATIALMFMSRREESDAGVWVWLLAIPVLGTLPLLRFDVIPTAIAVVALTLNAGRVRDRLFGAVVGLGIAIKAWPVLLLISVPTARRAISAVTVAAITAGAFVAISWATLGGGLKFLSHHAGRGLELEAVAATPWYLSQAITGRAVHWVGQNGSIEIASPMADLLAHFLALAMLILGVALVAWWVAWQRSEAPRKAAEGRDAVFTALLLYMVVSEVLSPQYLIWLIGLGAVAIASPACRVRRPIAMVVLAVLLTRLLLNSWGDLVSNGAYGAYVLALRNAVLVAAALDAAVAMCRLVRTSVMAR